MNFDIGKIINIIEYIIIFLANTLYFSHNMSFQRLCQNLLLGYPQLLFLTVNERSLILYIYKKVVHLSIKFATRQQNIMSKFVLEKSIQAELKKVNDVIDIKIIRGISYKRDALRHRFLLNRLSDLHRLPKFQSNWLQRSVNVMATFLL